MSASVFAQRYSKPITPESESDTEYANATTKMALQRSQFAPEWMNRDITYGTQPSDDLRSALHGRPREQPIPAPHSYVRQLGQDVARAGGRDQRGDQQPHPWQQKPESYQQRPSGEEGGGYGGYEDPWQQQRHQAYQQPLYTSPPAGYGTQYGNQQPWYGQQMYAPYQLQTQFEQYLWQNHAPAQIWLTPQFQANDEVPPPPPPPEQGFQAINQTSRQQTQPSLNPNASAYAPQQPLRSVSAADLNKRFRVNKPSRYDPGNSNNKSFDASYPRAQASPVNAAHGTADLPLSDAVKKAFGLIPTLQAKKARAKASKKANQKTQAQDDATFQASLAIRVPPYSPKPARLSLLKRPEPTAAYLASANKDTVSTSQPRPLLVILDLNGTLLFRKNAGSNFVARPRMREFLHYLITNHKVMIWSSAKPINVNAMVDKIFSPEEKELLVGVWARDKLNLTSTQYNEKVQVYKQLSWIWKDEHIQSLHPDPQDWWSQENTLLIDDSLEKAASEPHNILRIDEFEATHDQMKLDVLGQVVRHMEVLKTERNVSAYMRVKPFVYDAKAEVFDWMEIVNDMH